MLTNLREQKFWHISANETETILDTDRERGLSDREAKSRLDTFGRNTFESSKRASGIKIFLNQLKSPLIFVLITAGIVTLLISHERDALFIFIAVLVNSMLGFWQENKAEKALAELKTYLKQRARVIRDGVEKEIDAEELVPGDIIRLSQGDRIPADARIIFANDLEVDESILTGESLPVAKSTLAVPKTSGVADQSSMIFAGTLVTEGVATAITVRTSNETEIGKIAVLINKSNNEKTPLQKAITKLSLYLSIVLVIMTVGIFVIGLLYGKPLIEMFLTSVAVAVSAIPEGLPISMTVILAIGVERMAKRKGVVRKLVAAEALGSTTLILTDKTGTLTEAKMVMSKIIPFGCDENKILSYALTNSNVLIENPQDKYEDWRIDGRIMEIALAKGAAVRGFSFKQISGRENVLDSLPFNSRNKYSAAIIKEGEKIIAVFLGAPDILLSHSKLDDAEKNKIHTQIDEMALGGERILGVAIKGLDSQNFKGKDIEISNLSFAGFITFKDPVRSGIKKALERVERSGIKTVIMTGDHKGTAVAVAKEIGMNISDDSVLDAKDLVNMKDDEVLKILPKILVISRVTPMDKLRIAKLYQQNGEIVAMTGDGVNDAPSIKQADVGIAMGSGTEVAQSVADLILLDNNFETIVAAIEEGRQILGNIRKVLVYLLSNIADELMLIGGSLLAGLPLPLNALQILWVNFFSDSFPAIAFAFEKDPDGLAHRPGGKKLVLFNPMMKFLILVIGLLTSALLFAIYFILINRGYDEDIVRTFIFASFGTYSLLVALSIRSLERSIFSYPFFSNKYLTFGILAGISLMAMAIYVPFLQSILGTVSLPIYWVGLVFLIGAVNILLIEISKKFWRHN